MISATHFRQSFTPLAAAFIVLIALAIPVAAQEREATITTEQFGGWTVRCVVNDEGRNCIMFQSITNQQTNQEVMRLTVNSVPGSNLEVLRIRAPHGISLSAGLTLQLPDGEVNIYPFTVCDSTGCYTPIPLDRSMVNALESRNDALIQLTRFRSEDPLVLRIPLEGFEDALDEFRG